MFNNTSLISILKREEEIVCSLNRAERTVELWKEELTRIQECPAEWKAEYKDYILSDIQRYSSWIAESQAEADEHRKKLCEVRKEIFEYFSELKDTFTDL